MLSSIGVLATPQLSLDITAPSSNVDIDGLTVTATLRNTGDESLKLLNDPHTVLSKAPTNTFSITSGSGSPDFTGIGMKYVPAMAAALGEESDFTVLAAGQSIEVSHSLTGVYNFTRSGNGAYTFTAGNLFHYVDPSGELKTIEATSLSNSNRFEISGKLVAPSIAPRTTGLKKRPVTYQGCDAQQQGLTSDAVTGSVTYVRNSIDYLGRISSGTNRYREWFGAFTTGRLGIVRGHFSQIGTDAQQQRYDCTTCRTNPPPNVVYSSTYAYVYPTQPGTIYLCGVFWRAPAAGTDSRSGTIIHELSHFGVNGGATDVPGAENQAGARNLARTNPNRAVMSANNIEYFAENTPFLS